MNAAETIASAIQKLEELKSSSTRGPWKAAAGLDDERNLEYSLIAQRSDGFFDVLEASNDDVHRASADADLVEVLHRTIDAQLVILRKAHEQVSWYIKRVGNKDEPFTFVPAARRRRRVLKLWGEPLALARAILGEVSS